MRTGPDYIQFYPTLRCNKSCSFCFNKEMAAMDDMSPAVFAEMLRTLARVSVRTIDIIGGEPTLHSDIVAMVQEAVERGFLVNISSNGTRLDVLSDIMDVGPRVTVGISVNDHKVLTSMAEFIRSKRPVVKTVFAPSMDESLVRSILALAPRKFFLIYRDAQDRHDMKDCLPFPQFVSKVRSSFDPALVGMVYCAGFIVMDENDGTSGSVRCPAGTTKLGVLPDGSVYPCNLFFGRDKLLLGNIVKDQFEKIWSSAVLSFFRTDMQNACARSSCGLHTTCHGGCPAQSLLLTGDQAAPDPRCTVR